MKKRGGKSVKERESERVKVLLCGRKVSLPAKEKGGDD